MNRGEALQIVKVQLTEHRYTHTIGVMETAIMLSKKYNVSEEKAEIAAIFHDYAKFRPKEEMKQIIIQKGMPFDLLDYDSELWHAPVGAYLVETEVGIKDLDILNAIKYHTSGRADMTTLDKIVYLADYIEPGRKFPGVEEVREIANNDLNLALIQSVKNTIQFLLSRNQSVYPDTLFTYNSLLREYNAGRNTIHDR
jgi:predicted HD superfamily hydrolase involved in NAD metabolism